MGVSDSKSLSEEEHEVNPIFCNAIPDFHDPIPSPTKHHTAGRSKSRSVSPVDDGSIPYFVSSSRGPSEIGDVSPKRRSSFLRNSSLDEVLSPSLLCILGCLLIFVALPHDPCLLPTCLLFVGRV